MERRLVRMIALLVAVTVGGLLVLLPYRLYERDLGVAREHARLVSDELATMVRMTMLTMKDILALDPSVRLDLVAEKIEDLYFAFDDAHDLEFRVIRAPIVEFQYMAIEGRSADRPEIEQVLKTGTPQSDLDGVILTSWSPITATDACGECHKDLEHQPVKTGTPLGVVETTFDLTRQRQQSVRTIAGVTGFLAVMIAAMGIVTLTVIRKSLVNPLRTLSDALRRRAADPEAADLPRFETEEMSELMAAIETLEKRDLT